MRIAFRRTPPPVPEAEPRLAAVPEGCRYYATGDIHGALPLLKDAMERIDADRVARPAPVTVEIYLGDYVDRGPASSGVIEALMERRQVANVVCLAGNHELMMLAALRSDEAMATWCRYGGLDTLASYGVGAPSRPGAASELRTRFAAALPSRHLGFLTALSLYHVAADYLFVHAGIRPGVALAEQSREDLTMIREPFLSGEDFQGFVVVHGHTPVKSIDRSSNRLNIDTGAFATGVLTTIAIEGQRIRQI